MPTYTNTIHFIAWKSIPARRTVTYGRIVTTIRPTKAETHRVRLTVGGYRINYSGDKSTPTAEIQTIKALLNSMISTPNATFSTADMKDIYLNTPLSMCLLINIIPEEIILQYNLRSLVVDGYVYFEIRKGMYELTSKLQTSSFELPISSESTKHHRYVIIVDHKRSCFLLFNLDIFLSTSVIPFNG